jgi:hypothetical protein
MFLQAYWVLWPHIRGHNTEYVNNNTYTWTINVILAKHWLWLPDDGLHKPKHVEANVITLNVLIIHILI